MPRASGGASSTAASGGGRRTSVRASLWFSILLIVVLAGGDFVALSVNSSLFQQQRHYFMALGNSISFGYQPDLDFTEGFVDDVFSDLHGTSVTDVVNYACAGEKTQTMIDGGCFGHLIHHNAYTGAQLDAAVTFLQRHQRQVNLVTLEIGANDVLADWDSANCMARPGANTDLATMDDDLTHTILPRLVQALEMPPGERTGDLVMLNYYNPFIKDCRNSAPFAHLLNDHLAADAALFRIPIVDVYTAFGGDDDMAKHICDYTWMCDPQFHDFHPTVKGYRVIADAVERTLGYPGIGPAVSGPSLTGSIASSVAEGVFRSQDSW